MLALGLAYINTKRNDKAKVWKEGCLSKIWKRFAIQGGSQKMAETIINVNNDCNAVVPKIYCH